MAGILIYVMGPSGAGKDSLLREARRFYVTGRRRYGVAWPHRPVLFLRRWITRPAASGGERHHALTSREFDARRAAGEFFMHWESHGLHYGIHRRAEALLARNHMLVMNGSRDYLPEALRRCPDLVPLYVSASPEALRARLLARGREQGPDLEERLRAATRPYAEVPGLIVVDNSGVLEEAVEGFLAVLGTFSLRCPAFSV